MSAYNKLHLDILFFKFLQFIMRNLSLTYRTSLESQPVAFQVTKFWSSICDEELEIQEEYAEDSSGDFEILHFQIFYKTNIYLQKCNSSLVKSIEAFVQVMIASRVMKQVETRRLFQWEGAYCKEILF